MHLPLMRIVSRTGYAICLQALAWPVLLSAVLFAAALTIRLLYLRDLAGFPLFDFIPTSVDHFNFDRGALNFARGDWLASAPNITYSPLYKYFIGFLYWIFGRNFYWVYGIQFLMGSVAAVMVFWIGKRLFGPVAGLFAFIFFGFYGAEIIYEGVLLRAAFIAFWGIAAFYFLLWLESRPGPTLLVAATLALSLFFQGRPNTLLVLPFVCVFLSRQVFNQKTMGPVWRSWTIFWATLLVSFIPLLIQCYVANGRFVFFDASGPHTFISGNLTGYSGVGFQHELVEAYQRKNVLGYASNILYLLNQIAGDPVGFVLLYLRKLFFFFNEFEAPTNISIYLYGEHTSLSTFMLNRFSIVAALALVGLAAAIKNGKRIFLLYGFMLAMTFSVVLFLNESRYRVPAAPWYALMAGYGASCLVQWVAQRKLKSAAAGILTFFILLYAFQETSGLVRVRANDYGNLGAAYMHRNEEAKALEAFETARNLEPGSPYVRINLGNIYARRGQMENAGREFSEALKINPTLWEGWFNLGLAYLKIGLYQPALDSLASAQTLQPNHPGILTALGEAYRMSNRPGEAVEYLNRAAKLDPKPARPYFLLGLAYRDLKQYGESALFFKKALAQNPTLTAAQTELDRLAERGG